MAYTTVFRTVEGDVSCMAWQDELEAAKCFACEHIVAVGASSAEVRDEDDVVLFRFPAGLQ
jgi:alcohol dehydrogenase class IV